MPRFRLRPPEVEAIQYTGVNDRECLTFAGDTDQRERTVKATLGLIQVGDWLVKNPAARGVEIMANNLFLALYELIPEALSPTRK